MVTVKQLDELQAKMEQSKLSIVLPQLYMIALEEKDYIDFCMLYFWGNPFCGTPEANNVVRGEMVSFLMGAGVANDDIVKICEIARNKYLDMRKIEDDKYAFFCAREIEDHISRFDKYESLLDLPPGLAPIDVYYSKDDVAKEKMMLLKDKQIYEQQYSLLYTFMSNKIVEYKINALKNSRTERINKNSKNVFIIHGHDEAKLLELRTMLKEKFNLNPIILREQPEEGMTIIEKFEKYAEQCSYAFALFTPDDIIAVDGEEYFQARPNVIFELGWFYANLGRSRVCILEKASEKSKIFSDLQGILRIQFRDNIEEKYLNIERELRSVGMI